MAEDLLSAICFVRFGAPLSDDNRLLLRAELIAHLKVQQRNGTAALTEQAIRSWLPNRGQTRAPKRASAMNFLREYLARIEINKLVPGDRKARLHQLDSELSMFSLPTLASKLGQLSQGAVVAGLKLEPPDPQLLLMTQVLTAISRGTKRSEVDDLFRGGESENSTDQSYYLVYRYSTMYGAVLKTFIAIQKPKAEIRKLYTFNHFIWSAESDRMGLRNHIFRECEGFVLKFDKSYYLLGYNFIVKDNKRLNPQGYMDKREAARFSPNGLGMIVIEYEEIENDPGLFGGVTMTMAASSQSVIARIALLHLGTRSALGLTLNDFVVQPTELEVARPRSVSDVIGADLRAVVSRLRQMDCKKFGEKIQTALDRSGFDAPWESGLAEAIANRIANVPGWEAQQAEQKKKGTLDNLGHGAIETFNKVRA